MMPASTEFKIGRRIEGMAERKSTTTDHPRLVDFGPDGHEASRSKRNSCQVSRFV